MAELGAIEEARREPVRAALAEVFGAGKAGALSPVTGGVSGAQIFRFEADGAAWLLRLDRPADVMRDPVRHYAAMRAAAEAGIAPPLLHADPHACVAIMQFIETRPLTGHAGGKVGLARELGELGARLQRTEPFAPLADYPVLLRRMFDYLRGSGMFGEGLIDPHVEAFERLAGAYPWDKAEQVSSHNDPNFRNTLYDGQRLWLIDWETAYRNDPFVDLAIWANELEAGPELEAALVRAWLGRAPTRRESARLRLMRSIVQFYYAVMIFALIFRFPREGPLSDLAAPTPEEFRAGFAAGRYIPGAPQTMLVLGKMLLAGFLISAKAPDAEAALAVMRAG